MSEAVEKLLIAATYQWNVEDQIFLLRAAQHGKTFLNHREFRFDYFVKICQDLRIINSLRNYETPRFITYDQYKTIEKRIIESLIKTHNFHLAREISYYLDDGIVKVYEKWAAAKIKVTI